jgi:hypothetical protein
MSIFGMLNAINVNDKTEKKNGLTYLSWAWAWGEVKKVVPNATYTIYERETEFGPVNYFTDGKTCWVKTGVTLDGLEHIEELPVMDFKNRSIPLDSVSSTDVNKAIQRSLTKACARHGLGLYIYAGEDLPECEKDEQYGQEEAEVNAKKERLDRMTRTGSAEAAQEAGRRKLEELNRKAEEAAKNSPSARQAATPEQIAIIKDIASDEDYLKIMQKYGADMEKLTANTAARLIAELEKRNAEAV